MINLLKEIRQKKKVLPKGGYRANLKEGQSVVGALKNFQKLVTSVRCMQQFQSLTTDRRLSIHFLRKFTIIVVYFEAILEVE